MLQRYRVPLVLVAAAALVLLAVVVANAPADRGASIASPTASHSPSASPQPAVLSDRFGFVWADERSGIRVRSETGTGGFEVVTLGYRWSYCSCAVSPDGTRILYWTSRSYPGPVELRVIEVAPPSRQTTVFTAPPQQLISHATWSSDGNGILFSIEGVPAPGTPVGFVPSSALLAVDAGGGTPRTLADKDGGIYVPLGWDRAAGVAAAGLTGEGGYMTGYLTVRTTGEPALKRSATGTNLFMFSVEASSDQRFVYGVFLDASGGTLRWWRLGDFGSIQTGPHLDSATRARWRPQSSEIAWAEGGVLQLLDAERGTRRTGGSLPAIESRLEGFRLDGSAALVTSQNELLLQEIGSGRRERITAYGFFVAAVRLR